MSDNDSYGTLSDEIGITPHSMLGGLLPAIGENLKKRCPITLADVKTDQKPKELNSDCN